MSSTNLDGLQAIELYLDSQYASVNLNSPRNSDLYFFLKTPIIVGNDHDIVLRVDNFTCPISFTLVNTSNNRLTTDAGSFFITPGNYNALSLRAELARLLPTFTVSFDSVTGKLTFQAGASFSFLSSSTCFKLLGFIEGSNRASTANSLTSDYVVNLSGTSLIYIDVPNLTTRNVSSRNGGAFTTIVKSLPVAVPYGSILSYVNNTSAATKLGEKYISFIQVRLLDDDYNVLDLGGQHFTLTIEIFFFKNGNEPGFRPNLIEEAVRQQEAVKKSLK
jgi:hypothetical protein